MSYIRFDKNVTQSGPSASAITKQHADKIVKGRHSVDQQLYDNESRAYKQFRSNNISKTRPKDPYQVTAGKAAASSSTIQYPVSFNSSQKLPTMTNQITGCNPLSTIPHLTVHIKLGNKASPSSKSSMRKNSSNDKNRTSSSGY